MYNLSPPQNLSGIYTVELVYSTFACQSSSLYIYCLGTYFWPGLHTPEINRHKNRMQISGGGSVGGEDAEEAEETGGDETRTRMCEGAWAREPWGGISSRGSM